MMEIKKSHLRESHIPCNNCTGFNPHHSLYSICPCRCHWYEGREYSTKIMDPEIAYEIDANGWWIASVPSLPGCQTQGHTQEEARERIHEAIKLFRKDTDWKQTEDQNQIQMFQGSKINPWLNTILSKIALMHDSKNHDYATGEDIFFNFVTSAKYVLKNKPIQSQLDKQDILNSFNEKLGTKLARLFALIQKDKTNNESFTDSEWDFVVYFLLRESFKLKTNELEQTDKPNEQ